MSSQKMSFGCPRGQLDHRDYTYFDALDKSNRQTGQHWDFAVLDLRDENQEKEEKDKWCYPCKIYSPLSYRQFLKKSHQQNPPPTHVFIPLNSSNYSLMQSVVMAGTGGVKEANEPIEGTFKIRKVDLQKYFTRTGDWPPIEDQMSGYMCAANAGVALLEYFERRAEGRHLDASRQFLHYVACKLMNLDPTSGVSVKGVVRALARVGVPPEAFWPYDPEKILVDPTPLCYALARDFRANSYFRVDYPGINLGNLIYQAKLFVNAGLPVILGFDIYDSIDQSVGTGSIPLPTWGEKYLGGHAAVIVGYDDEKLIENVNLLGEWDREKIFSDDFHVDNEKVEAYFNVNEGGKHKPCFVTTRDGNPEQYISAKWEHDHYRIPKRAKDPPDLITITSRLFVRVNSICKGEESSAKCADEEVADTFVTKGAFRIRNTWGKDWGDKGYGWLPYAYILQGYTFDWWSVLKFDWINIDGFGFSQNGNEIVENPYVASSYVPPHR